MRLHRPTEIAGLLEAHGLSPRKLHGQNFVVDANIVRKVVRDAGVRPGELVCEIGPGLGSLTLALRGAGARVVAVEIDAGFVRVLDELFGDDDDVAVVHADALRVDLRDLVAAAQERWDTPVRPALVANLPYNVATPLLITTLRAEVFARALVMVQKEVGQRWTARVGHPLYSAVSVKVAALADADIAAAVPRNAFYPVPNVDSVTVRLHPRAWEADVDRDVVFAVVEQGFAQRRKRLRNALAGGDRSAARVEDALRAAGLDVGARAEELALPDWVALAAALSARTA